MKSVFIAASRKFYGDVEKLVCLLRDNGIRAETAGKVIPDQRDTPESEKGALLSAFEKIADSEVVYILTNDGYVGKTVAMEIAYAYAKKKEIISSDEIEELSARALIDKIMKPEELVEYAKT